MRFLLVLPLFFLLSCVSYTTISFDELKPAEFFVNKNVANVALINSAKLQRDVSHFFLVAENSPLPVDSQWNDSFNSLVLKSFYDDLSQKKFFDSIVFDTTSVFPNYSGQIPLFLDSIANSTAVQGFFVLSKSNYKTYVKIDPISYNQYYGYLEGISSINIVFYNVLKHQFEDSFLVQDTIYSIAQTGTINQLNDLLLTPTQFTTQLATDIGKKICKRYVPNWQTVSRGVFTGGSYFLSEGANFVATQNWPDAIKMWRYAVDKGNDIVKARACYNLAVMAEMHGDLPSAQSWLNESLLHYNSKANSHKNEIVNANNYLALINIRVIESQKLNDQIDAPR